jgi:hypothetical protein
LEAGETSGDQSKLQERDDAVNPTSAEAIHIFYADDPDPERAGQGLATAPFIQKTLGREALFDWLMLPAEQVGLLFLLEHLRPKVAIEIGTRLGGSLQVLSHFSGKVYSLDIDQEVPIRLRGKFPNVEYIIGSSVETLPRLLNQIQANNEELSFALVDGDHSAEGVRKDIDALLRYAPTVPFYIVMHDSFNPQCRKGLRSVGWASSPYVHYVELDFVPGTATPAPALRGQLWGGLALAYLHPEKRQGRFEVMGSAELSFQAALAKAPQGTWVNRLRTFTRRAGRKLQSALFRSASGRAKTPKRI